MVEKTKIDFYDYDPSLAAAIIFAVLYTLTCLLTIYQFVAKRCWFWVFMVISAMMESAGYISRTVSVTNREELSPYAIQYCLIFLAPAIMAAACYMAMGRIVLHVTPMDSRTIKLLWVTPRWMTPIFVGCDIAAFLIQTLGAIRLVNKDASASDKTTALRVMEIGLAVQLVCFGLFLIISFRFHIVSKTFRLHWPDDKWVSFLWALNIACSLIFIRSIYRMIEFTTGIDSYLARHEWNFYVFESVVILPIFVLFNIWHPANHVRNIGWRQKKTVGEWRDLDGENENEMVRRETRS